MKQMTYERIVDAANKIMGDHVFKGTQNPEYQLHVHPQSIKVYVAPNLADRVEQELAKFFKKHPAHPLKSIKLDVVPEFLFGRPPVPYYGTGSRIKSFSNDY